MLFKVYFAVKKIPSQSNLLNILTSLIHTSQHTNINKNKHDEKL